MEETKKQKIKMPKSTQNTIPLETLFSDGVIKVKENVYSLMFEISNIEYRMLAEQEQERIYNDYQKILNTLPVDITYQEVIVNNDIDYDMIQKKVYPINKDMPYYDEYIAIQELFIENSRKTKINKKIIGCISYQPISFQHEGYSVLDKYFNELYNLYQEISCNIRKLSPVEILKLIYSYYHNFNDDFRIPNNIYKFASRLKDYIAPAFINIQNNKITIDETYSRTLFVKSFDNEVDDSFIFDLTDGNYKIIVSKFINHIDKCTALESITKRIKNVESKIQEKKSKNKKSGTDYVSMDWYDTNTYLRVLREKLSETATELFDTSVYITILADDTDELEEITSIVKSRANKHQVKLEVLLGQQEKGFNSTLPFAYDFLQSSKAINLLTDGMAILTPLSYVSYALNQGILYGNNINSNDLIILDRNDEMNSNGFVLAPSGSGKSFFVKLEILNIIAHYPNAEIIVIDPDREFIFLKDKFDGEILKLSPQSDKSINLFDIDMNALDEGQTAIAMKSDFIMTVCSTAKGQPLTSNEISVIDRCVKDVYQAYIKTYDIRYLPTLDMFYNTLKSQPEKEAKDIAMSLEIYATGSFNLFAKSTNIDTSKNILVMDLHDLGNQLKHLGLQVILEYLWQRVERNTANGKKTFVWVDEFSVMMSNENSIDFFQKAFKRIRKYGGTVTAITQNLTEVLANKYSANMLANSEFCVLLQQNTELDTVAKTFNLSEQQKNTLNTGKIGTGLIKCGKKIIPFSQEILKDSEIQKSELFKILSTKFEDKEQTLKNDNNTFYF